MKRNLLHTIWVAAAVLLAASCEQEELPGVGADGTQTLAITVTDGGYAPADRDGGSPAGVPQTRAVENGYITGFTAGDACGLYIVRGGELACANVKLTATAATDGTLTWQPEAGVTLTGGFNGEAYYLYYPYRDDSYMADKTMAASATDDAAFFATLVSTWQPQADQSIYTTGYTASDLMTATGTATTDGSTLKLSFSMAHRMALAVIELPGKKYVFTNTGGSAIPDYTVPTSADFTGSDAKPCRMTDGSYRYIVNPTATATAPEITGSYAGGSKKFTFTPSSAPGSYKTYKIDGGSTATVEQTYTLQVGDYLCSSGNASGWYIISKELAPTESDNCIGIVLKAGRDNEGSWADNGTYTLKGGTTPMAVHGYVLALRDAHGGCPWGSYGIEVDCDRNQTTGFNGYSSTQTIVAFNNARGGTLQDAFPAVYHATNYETVCSAPANTSGWFLPSGGQCQYWLNHRDVILRSIQNAGGDGWKDRYWSSSETSHNPASNAYYLYMRYGNVSRGSKNSVSAVRACLAF